MNYFFMHVSLSTIHTALVSAGALRAGFEKLQLQLQTRQITPTMFDGGSAAILINSYKPPDMNFFIEGNGAGLSPDHCPGDLKVSWKWKSVWRTAAEECLQRQYRLILS